MIVEGLIRSPLLVLEGTLSPALPWSPTLVVATIPACSAASLVRFLPPPFPIRAFAQQGRIPERLQTSVYTLSLELMLSVSGCYRDVPLILSHDDERARERKQAGQLCQKVTVPPFCVPPPSVGMSWNEIADVDVCQSKSLGGAEMSRFAALVRLLRRIWPLLRQLLLVASLSVPPALAFAVRKLIGARR